MDGALTPDEYAPAMRTPIPAGHGLRRHRRSGAVYMNSDATTCTSATSRSGLNDVAVIYLNTKSGGYTDATMDDATTSDRKAISNLTQNPDDAFPFLADYALAIWNQSPDAFLYELQPTGSTHTFISNANVIRGTSPASTKCPIPLATLGVLPGGNVDFFVAYCSTTNFCSNEVDSAVRGAQFRQQPRHHRDRRRGTRCTIASRSARCPAR